MRLTKVAYGWDPDKTFYIPDEALAHFREAVPRGEELVADWEKRLAAYERDHPELAAEFRRRIAGKLPRRWDADLPR